MDHTTFLLFEHKKQMKIGVCPLSLVGDSSGLGGIDSNGMSKRGGGLEAPLLGNTRKVVVSPFSIETKEGVRRWMYNTKGIRNTFFQFTICTKITDGWRLHK